MSDVLHDEWDRAYEEGKEAGLSEAWSGEYTYRMLMDRVRDKAIRDCIEAVDAYFDRGELSPAQLMDDLSALLEKK